jgi:hypothetical protein
MWLPTLPDKVEYWFNLDADTLVLAFHNLIKEMECSRKEKILSIVIEYSAWNNREYKKQYSMVVVKSYKPLSKSSLIDLLKRNLIGGKSDWRRGR